MSKIQARRSVITLTDEQKLKTHQIIYEKEERIRQLKERRKMKAKIDEKVKEAKMKLILKS